MTVGRSFGGRRIGFHGTSGRHLDGGNRQDRVVIVDFTQVGEMITRCTVKSNSPSTKRAAHSHVLLSASGHAKSPIHTALLFMSQSVIGSSVGLVPTNAPAVTDQFAGERPTLDLPFPNQAQLCSTRRRVSPG